MRATTFTLIPDDTTVEYTYKFYPNIQVSYQWENAPSSVVLPSSAEYRNSAYHKDKIVVDSTYVNGSQITENGEVYTFTGWEKTQSEKNVIIFTGKWTVEAQPQEPETEEDIPPMPHTDIGA